MAGTYIDVWLIASTPQGWLGVPQFSPKVRTGRWCCRAAKSWELAWTTTLCNLLFCCFILCISRVARISSFWIFVFIVLLCSSRPHCFSLNFQALFTLMIWSPRYLPLLSNRSRKGFVSSHFRVVSLWVFEAWRGLPAYLAMIALVHFVHAVAQL